MRNENITNEAVSKFCKTFPKISQLTQLSLSLSEYIKKYSFHNKLNSCANLSNEAVLAISRNILNLKQLTDLSIALENYCKDEIFTEFKNSILQLEGLHRLQLQFELYFFQMEQEIFKLIFE